MSKYNPLSERLSGHADDEWRASFAELEQVLGFALPKGARSGSSWWANDPEKGHSRAWTGAGWEVAEVDRQAESVTFRRNRASADIEAAGGITPGTSADASVAALKEDPDARGLAWAAGSDSVRPETPRRERGARLRRAMPAIAAGAAVAGAVATFAARVMIRRAKTRG